MLHSNELRDSHSAHRFHFCTPWFVFQAKYSSVAMEGDELLAGSVSHFTLRTRGGSGQRPVGSMTKSRLVFLMIAVAVGCVTSAPTSPSFRNLIQDAQKPVDISTGQGNGFMG